MALPDKPTTFAGIVHKPSNDPAYEAFGPFNVTLDPRNQAITGNMSIGQPPGRGLTGFGGTYDPNTGMFKGDGVNTVQNNPTDPFDDIQLDVIVTGEADGQGNVVGVVQARVNGVEQPVAWNFRATDTSLIDVGEARSQARRILQAAGGAITDTTDVVIGTTADAWDAIPGWVKVSGLIAGGYLLGRKYLFNK